ncbi:MAG: hypothetical protein AAF570_15765, partial [Bacteroidota bacterium]
MHFRFRLRLFLCVLFCWFCGAVNAQDKLYVEVRDANDLSIISHATVTQTISSLKSDSKSQPNYTSTVPAEK